MPGSCVRKPNRETMNDIDLLLDTDVLIDVLREYPPTLFPRYDALEPPLFGYPSTFSTTTV